MANAVRVVVNPANTKMRYVLWGDGRIDNIGGALAIPQADDVLGGYSTPAFNQFPGTAGSRPAPLWLACAQGYGDKIATALWITDWNGPSGFVLSRWGKVSPFGAAPDPPSSTISLFPYSGVFALDLVVDPSGTIARGYMLCNNFSVIRWGTSGNPDINTSGMTYLAAFAGTLARRFSMLWSSYKMWILDAWGRVWTINPDNSPSHPSVAGTAPSTVLWPGDGSAGLMMDDQTNVRGWVGNWWGGVFTMNYPGDTAPPKTIYKNVAGPNIVDNAILDDGSTGNPIVMCSLFSNGALLDFVSTAPPACVPGGAGGTPADPTTTGTRPAIAWSYNDPDGTAQKQYEVVVYPSSVWNAAGLLSEVWSLTATGATAGTFTLTFDGATTAAIAWNATAATVQTALTALATIGTGGVVCTGGPLPGAVTITFAGKLAKMPIDPNSMQANTYNTLTGGRVAVTETTKGTLPLLDMTQDLRSNGAIWQTWGSDAAIRSVTPPVNLPNDATGLRAFIRLTSAGLISSGWRVRQWVQNVTPLPTPTLTPTVVGGLNGVRLALSVASPPAGTVVCVQFQDSDAADPNVWDWVRNGWSVALTGGAATLVDYEARFGIRRLYRAQAYELNPYNSSAWSASSPAILLPLNLFTLTDPLNSSLGGSLRVEEPPEEQAQITAGVFYPPGRGAAVVISSGPPKSPKITLNVHLLSASDRQTMDALLQADDPIYYRTPFGRAFYGRLTDTTTRKMVHAAPMASEQTSVRDAHLDTLILTTIDRPDAGPQPGVGPNELVNAANLAWAGPPPINNDVTNVYSLL